MARWLAIGRLVRKSPGTSWFWPAMFSTCRSSRKSATGRRRGEMLSAHGELGPACASTSAAGHRHTDRRQSRCRRGDAGSRRALLGWLELLDEAPLEASFPGSCAAMAFTSSTGTSTTRTTRRRTRSSPGPGTEPLGVALTRRFLAPSGALIFRPRPRDHAGGRLAASLPAVRNARALGGGADTSRPQSPCAPKPAGSAAWPRSSSKARAPWPTSPTPAASGWRR